ncbi:MAG: glutathione S-transferase family protein [Myxococcaceae bacterium]
MRLYSTPLSGNCYKVRLALAQLKIPCEVKNLDLFTKKESQTPEFKATKNLAGRVPVLELDDGRCLAESAAILLYLADGSHLLPRDPWERALVHQWLFFEQNQVSPELAGARVIVKIMKQAQQHPEIVRRMRNRGNAALTVMEEHLRREPYFAAGRYTVADIALYAYTHLAEEGGFQLAHYPAVCGWLDRVKSQPGHLPMNVGA